MPIHHKRLIKTYINHPTITYIQYIPVYEKARKASFKLRKLVNNEDLAPKLLIDLFDKLIKPIAMYGTEIWLSPQKIEKNFIKFTDTVPAEQLHKAYLRYTLGTHKKATNLAIMGETGRVPLAIQASQTLIDYRNKILFDGDTSPILKEALEESRNLASKKRGWYYETEEVIKLCNKEVITDTDMPTNYNVKASLTEKYINHWDENTNNGGKLRTMRLFKNNFRLETYLEIIKNGNERKQLTRLRLSAHRLEIERGRYKGIEIGDRKCNTCMEVEDEIHFMMRCKLYDKERKILMNMIEETAPNSTNLDEKSKFIFLMSSEGEIVKQVAKTVTLMFRIREERHEKDQQANIRR